MIRGGEKLAQLSHCLERKRTSYAGCNVISTKFKDLSQLNKQDANLPLDSQDGRYTDRSNVRVLEQLLSESL